jgi:cell division protein ZapA
MSSANDGQPAAESVRVNIFGQTYSLRSTQGGERVRRVAELVDERMREIASQLAVHDAAKVAVLAALNLADELELVRQHYEREIESLLTAEVAPAQVPDDEIPGGESFAPPATAAPAEEQTDRSREATADAAAPTAMSEARDASAAREPSRNDDERRSWFDEIFDSEFSSGSEGRLSSQVSSRLQRLRQATREGTISDGEPDDK